MAVEDGHDWVQLRERAGRNEHHGCPCRLAGPFTGLGDFAAARACRRAWWSTSSWPGRSTAGTFPPQAAVGAGQTRYQADELELPTTACNCSSCRVGSSR